MNKKMLSGIFTTLITPFNAKGDICEKTLKKLVDFQINHGITKLCPNGVTGETAALTDEEKIKIVDITHRYADGRAMIIPDMGTECLARTKSLISEAEKIGVSAVLAFTPYLDPPTKAGIEAYFLNIAEDSNIPLLIHNLPDRTTVDISIDSISVLAKHPHIAGMKEGNQSIRRFGELLEVTKNQDFVVLSGNDFSALPAMLLGAHGHISVAANIIPRIMASIATAAINNNDFVTARELYKKYHPLFRAMYLSTNPIAVKEIFKRCHFDCGPTRLPLTALEIDKFETLNMLIKKTELW
ncbi:4-hydroxy-tetrahydrodipicolinate synthase [Pragia fontium]|uniref:4-hydroxy-tetrahydrodipicolinate synthase n=1 Tax=Pragia fontium DSM 5563 = ATCC 49100 TaxID=1122977 RepID=A0AAJ4W8I2_9GAMM|nr:4-hydroxy-tetrahydrodipicolinate synthase [Pragia fontium]SFC19198.1 4-hydroxy-tetrahydrodipicolinate synthase [Pragia fontium DSM 5563 = ATCC 49100]VEJ53258.1 Dihydrodipicolinate synthase [Pragia fontium]